MSSIGTPVVGDPIYSTKSAKHKVEYLLLVSKYLKFAHPHTGKEMEFELNEYPSHVREFLDRMEQSSVKSENEE